MGRPAAPEILVTPSPAVASPAPLWTTDVDVTLPLVTTQAVAEVALGPRSHRIVRSASVCPCAHVPPCFPRWPTPYTPQCSGGVPAGEWGWDRPRPQTTAVLQIVGMRVRSHTGPTGAALERLLVDDLRGYGFVTELSSAVSPAWRPCGLDGRLIAPGLAAPAHGTQPSRSPPPRAASLGCGTNETKC